MSVTEVLESIATLTETEKAQVLKALQNSQAADKRANGNQDKSFQTAFDLAPELMNRLEGKHHSGLGDLATNKDYLKDLGKKSAEKVALAQRLKRE